MTRAFLDSNVPLYAVGSAHRLREPCRAVLRAVGDGDLEGVTSTEVLQEVLHKLLEARGRGDSRALGAYDRFAELMEPQTKPVEPIDLSRARALAETHTRLPARDLVHLAVMERHGLDAIVTADRHFDGLPGIRRLDPVAFAAT